ncbi:hypothetical protein AAC387_Pa06g1767 [Persea americana]
MDKTWTTLDSQDRMAIRMGREYRDGVKSFIEFAKANVGDATEIWMLDASQRPLYPGCSPNNTLPDDGAKGGEKVEQQIVQQCDANTEVTPARRAISMDVSNREVSRNTEGLRYQSSSARRERNMANWFLLYNTPEVIPYLEEHKRQVNELGGRNITNLQWEEFSGWFRDHVRIIHAE